MSLILSEAATQPARTLLGQLQFDWLSTNREGSIPEATAPAEAIAAVAAPTPLISPARNFAADAKRVVARSPQSPKLRRSLRETVERYLREHGIPYINVDEAKKALFAGARLRSFHFVVYRTDQRNWLLYTSQLRKESREDLIEWEKIFGDGFVAVVAKHAKAGLRFRTLNGESISLS